MTKKIMYEVIYQETLEKITTGVYKKGECLPSEKELAKIYEVSRITTKKAMDLLAERGFIVRTPGRGSFVKEVAEQGALEEIQKDPSVNEEDKRLIAVIFDTFGSDFGSELLKSIEQECNREGFTMVFKCSYGSPELENAAIQSSLKIGVKGIILMCAQGETYNNSVLRLALNDFPLVLVDRQMKGISIPCVKTDNRSAAKELTSILIDKGHRNICFVSHSELNTTTINDRYTGFTECILKYQDVKGSFAKLKGYNPAPEDVDKEYKQFDYTEIGNLVDQNAECTAFLAAEYRLAVLLGRVLKQKGMKKEIASFDALEPIYDEPYHFIHAKQNEREIGKQTVDTLIERINGGIVEENNNIPYEIIQ